MIILGMDVCTRAVTGTHFAIRIPAYKYPTGTWVPIKWMQHLPSLKSLVWQILDGKWTCSALISIDWH